MRPFVYALPLLLALVQQAPTPTPSSPAPAAAPEKAVAKSAEPSPLDRLAGIVGATGSEWRIKANWTKGAELNARDVWQWGPGKKFILLDTYVAKPEGGEYHRYHEVFTMEGGKMVGHTFTVDGSVETRPVQFDGTSLLVEFPAKGSAEPTTVRSKLEIVDADHMRWTVNLVKANTPDQQIMDGVWVRQK